LFSFRESLESLDPGKPPLAVPFGRPATSVPSRIGILSGSFDPPTEVHQELAARAATSFQLDRVFFTLARVIVDKEDARGLCAEDRLLLLSTMAEKPGGVSVAAVNRGLYFEQVDAFRNWAGRRAKLFVIVGMDKVLQIFDSRYYKDRDRALNSLFAEAQLIPAGRGSLQEEDLGRLLDRPENRPYRDRIYFMAMPDRWRDLSSSKLREKIGSRQFPQRELPQIVREFVKATGCYQPPIDKGGENMDRYAQRVSLLNILYRVRSWAEEQVDFKTLLEVACSDSPEGRRLRNFLYQARDPAFPKSEVIKELLSFQR
jgi:nicotinic acid mononucleotide adenylyltransferase